MNYPDPFATLVPLFGWCGAGPTGQITPVGGAGGGPFVSFPVIDSGAPNGPGTVGVINGLSGGNPGTRGTIGDSRTRTHGTIGEGGSRGPGTFGVISDAGSGGAGTFPPMMLTRTFPPWEFF